MEKEKMTEKEKLTELLQEYTGNNNGGGSNCEQAEYLIANDVEIIQHGEWISIDSRDNGENMVATCSNCHKRGKIRTNRNSWGLWYIDSPRCPHCGAKMK